MTNNSIFLISNEKDWKSKDPKVKASVKKKIELWRQSVQDTRSIHIDIRQSSRGKYRYSVSADCNNGQFFNAESRKTIHAWMLENVGCDYEQKLDGDVFSGSDDGWGGDFVWHQFETFDQAVGFANVVSESASGVKYGSH